jgi:virginiamycin B lyase
MNQRRPKRVGRKMLVIATTAVILIILGAIPISESHFQRSQGLGSRSPNITKVLPPSVDQVSPIREIPIESNETLPIGITTDANGDVWIAENNASALVEYVPSTGIFRTYPIPTNSSGLIWFLIFDNQGNLWFSNAQEALLWKFSPSTAQFSNFSTSMQGVFPYALAYNPVAEQIWFTSIYTDQIGVFQIEGSDAVLSKIINVTGTTGIRPSPPYFGPSGIALDAQGNVYVSETFSSNIVEYDPVLGRFVHVWDTPPGSQPVGVVVDGLRNRVWFTNHASSLIGYIDEATGGVTEYATSLFTLDADNITLPYWIQESADGSIWFDEHIGNKIAEFNPATGMLTEFAIATSQSSPLRFAIDNQRGIVWFTEFAANKIGELNLNESCDCSVKLSQSSITLSAANRSATLNVNSVKAGSASSQTALSPLVSGSLSLTGFLGSNLTISTAAVNSSDYRIVIGAGSDLVSGNYTITVCPRQSVSDSPVNPPPIRPCATASLTVANLPSSAAPSYIFLSIAVVAITGTLAISLVYVKRWRS